MRLCLERYIRSCEPPSTGSLSSSDAKSTYSHLYYKLTCLIEEAWTYLLIRVKLGIIRGTRHRFGGVSWRCRGERPCSLASEPYPGRPAAPQTLLPEAAKGQAPTSSARYLPCQVPQYIIIIIRDISSGRVMDRASRPQSRMSSRWQSRPRCHVVGASSSMARSPTMTNSISLEGPFMRPTAPRSMRHYLGVLGTWQPSAICPCSLGRPLVPGSTTPDGVQDPPPPDARQESPPVHMHIRGTGFSLVPRFATLLDLAKYAFIGCFLPSRSQSRLSFDHLALADAPDMLLLWSGESDEMTAAGCSSTGLG
ncbi:hypothetical protein HDV57DRAFT_114453 [Trichoderma longibrachiatum]